MRILIFIAYFLLHTDNFKGGFCAMEKIVGGGMADYEANYPWFVGLVEPNKIGMLWKSTTISCGSSLITHDKLLTAAHCYASHKDISPDQYHSVYSAVFMIKNRCNSTWENTVPILHVFVHSDYVHISENNDIAILTLERKVFYPPVKLPPRNFGISNPGIVIGFGSEKYKVPEESCTLKEGYLTVLLRSECLKSEIGPEMKNYTGMFCAGDRVRNGGGVDTCQGDSGGPLLIKTNGTFYIIGITSFGNGCSEAFNPGVYTNVSFYKEWIDTIINT